MKLTVNLQNFKDSYSNIHRMPIESFIGGCGPKGLKKSLERRLQQKSTAFVSMGDGRLKAGQFAGFKSPYAVKRRLAKLKVLTAYIFSPISKAEWESAGHLDTRSVAQRLSGDLNLRDGEFDSHPDLK